MRKGFVVWLGVLVSMWLVVKGFRPPSRLIRLSAAPMKPKAMSTSAPQPTRYTDTVIETEPIHISEYVELKVRACFEDEIRRHKNAILDDMKDFKSDLRVALSNLQNDTTTLKRKIEQNLSNPHTGCAKCDQHTAFRPLVVIGRLLSLPIWILGCCYLNQLLSDYVWPQVGWDGPIM